MKSGEIWNAKFVPELGERLQRIRPVIVIGNDAPDAWNVLVPVEDGALTMNGCHVPLRPTQRNGLTAKCAVDCFRIERVPHERFIQKLGLLSPDDMRQIKKGMIRVMGLV